MYTLAVCISMRSLSDRHLLTAWWCLQVMIVRMNGAVARFLICAVNIQNNYQIQSTQTSFIVSVYLL